MTFDPAVPLRWVVDLLFRNIGLKVLALGLTVLLFVLTRDEVTRHFEVPLRIIKDPERVLVTPIPSTVSVRVRGPWTRLNRLEAYDLGSATLDLREAEPGPLKIERGSIVMPPGVVLSELDYDEVDLRFEPVVRTLVPIAPQIAGAPHPDYRLVEVRSDPNAWTIEGGRSATRTVSRLTTELLDVDRAKASVERELAIIPPGAGTRLVVDATAPLTRVTVVIEPWIDRRTVSVPFRPSPDAAPGMLIPPAFDVVLVGPRAAFRQLDALGLGAILAASVEGAAPMGAEKVQSVEVRFEWRPEVPPEIRQALTFDPETVSLRVSSLP